MKINKFLITLGFCSVLLSSCFNDGKDEFLSDYATSMYFTHSGEQAVTCYKTGETTAYNVYIHKAGSDNKAEVDVSVTMMDASQLNIYNGANGTSYELLPSTCYTLEGDLSIHFSSEDLYKAITINLNTDEIDNLGTAEYVVPLVLTSTTNVNEERSQIFVKPEVVIPTIYFRTTGYNLTQFTSTGAEQATVTIPITMALNNQWNFDCGIAINDDLRTDYNSENGTAYSLLPEESYDLLNTYSFTPGSSTIYAELTIKRNALSVGEYMLPIVLSSCTQEGFEIDENQNSYLAVVSYMPPQIELTLDMLSSNATVNGDGTGLNGLIDGLGQGTHYHSDYSGTLIDPTYGHYIDIHLNTEIQSVQFDYWTRNDNSNGCPQSIKLYTSNDGITWTPLSSITSGLPNTANTEYVSSIFTAGNKFNYLRFAVVRNPTSGVEDGGSFFFSLDALSIYGQ